MRYLRYYAPCLYQEEHQRTLHLQEKTKEKHGVEYEEIPVKEREWYGKVPQMTESEVYEKHLKPCSRLIKINDPDKETASRKFKTRSGHIIVGGSIAVMENEAVLWATWYKQTEFLEDILNGKISINSFKSNKHLFEDKLIPSKKIKLGIVCEESDPEIEKACEKDGIEVFIFPEEENEGKRIESPIWGIYGKRMIEEGGEY